jgi:hypothetical protein
MHIYKIDILVIVIFVKITTAKSFKSLRKARTYTVTFFASNQGGLQS